MHQNIIFTMTVNMGGHTSLAKIIFIHFEKFKSVSLHLFHIEMVSILSINKIFVFPLILFYNSTFFRKDEIIMSCFHCILLSRLTDEMWWRWYSW